MRMPSNTMHIGILGLGAIGTCLYARLSPFTRVSAIIKSSQVATLQQFGLCLENEHHKVLEKQPVVRYTTASTLSSDPVDVLLIAVKSTATDQIARTIQTAPYMKKDTLVISLQNGLGNVKVLQSAWPAQQVFQGITYMGGRSSRIGHVQLGGSGPTFIEGSVDPGHESTLNHFVCVCQRAGVNAQLESPGKMQSRVWKKLIVNAAINPVACLLNGPNRVCIENKMAIQIMNILVHEALAVAKAGKIPLNLFSLVDVMDVARQTGSNTCSMLSDLQQGRTTEIQYINQVIVQRGQSLGIRTPGHQMMVYLIKALELQSSRHT